MDATLTDESVRITVTDAGTGFTPAGGRIRAHGGYGLFLVDRAASR